MSRPLIFGMVHLRALPGTPRASLSVSDIVKKAVKEADILFGNKCDGIIIENMHDVPYQRPDQRGPETTAIMTRAAVEIRRNFPQVDSSLWPSKWFELSKIQRNSVNSLKIPEFYKITRIPKFPEFSKIPRIL